MRYQNKKNGVIIDVQSQIAGDDWTALNAVAAKSPKKAAQKPAVVQTEPVAEVQTPVSAKPDATGIDGVTVKEIKQELDANGIEYSKNAKKQELYDLMMGM